MQCGSRSPSRTQEVQGLGSANPAPNTPFAAAEQRTYDGRALAIVRPTGPGPITLTVEAQDCAQVMLSVTAG